MSLPVGTGGEEHRGCGEDGCDCSLEGTANTNSTKQMSQNTLPEGGVQTFSHRAFVLNETKTKAAHKEETVLPC